MRFRLPFLVAALVLLLVSDAALAGEYVWMEGEDASQTSFNQHGWYTSTDIQADLLSPGVPGGASGDWLGHFSNAGDSAEASWDFSVTEGGSYTVWVRCNPFKTSQRWSIDGGEFEPMALDDVRGRLDLVDPGIDLRFIGWVQVGEVDLDAGDHTLTIGVDAFEGKAHAGLDAIVVENMGWAPAGATKPDAAGDEPAADAWFPLAPRDESSADGSVIDMSGLHDRPAGTHGALQRDGAGLAFADGTPVKFWGLNASMGPTADLQDQQASFYAKYGVNLVRQHPVEAVLGVLQTDANGDRHFDADRLDRFDRWFATLKEHGIYMQWSLFYPHVITPDDGYPSDLYDELPDRGAGKSTSGLATIEPALQDAEWEWARRLLDHTNPYTGMRYADDPALAVIETRNEDSIFWHAPLNDLAAGDVYPKHTARLQQKWMEWVAGHYADDQALAQAWGDGMRNGDSVSNPAMKIYAAWEMAADGPNGAPQKGRRRMGDFIRFLAETQRAGYERRQQRLRDLGFDGVTVSTAWKAGGPAAAAANLWADDAMDMIDRHAYFGGGDGGHQIAEGAVNNESHLGQPGRGILGAGMFQVGDKPFMLSEWTSKPPNQWKAETAPLFAFYGMGLQGWDASLHFAGSKVRMGSGWPSMSSYATETPAYLGQFPALVFAIEHGHITEGATAALRRLSTEQVFAGFDARNQPLAEGGWQGEDTLETPPEVMAIGRIATAFADHAQPSERVDWSTYWDQDAQTIESSTGELMWDYGRRVVQVKTPKTQAIIGFAGGETWQLPGVSATIDTPFVSLIFTPLDDRPLDESVDILVTALARDRQTGAHYNADGTQLEEAGGPPLLLEPVQAELEFGGAPIIAAEALDTRGVPTGTSVERDANTIHIDGRYATYYYRAQREGDYPEPDPDAGTGADAGTNDGGGSANGGQTTADAGQSGSAQKADEGCGCNHTSAMPAEWWLLLLGFAGWRRARKRGDC